MPVICGDCKEVIKRMDDNSIDSIVTDPPAGINFMGRIWDRDKGGRDQWIEWMAGIATECYRVIKPGGHALVWSLPRTSHWTATAWENGGFEVRDNIIHCFGQGFPKSLDISKQLDRNAGIKREVIGKRISAFGDTINSESMDGRNLWCKPSTTEVELTGDPVSNAAKQWNGWGTALKPAHEDWILLRKPLEGTVAQNVLKWGVGGINIDGCRVEYENTQDPATNPRYRLLNNYKTRVNGDAKIGATPFIKTKLECNIKGRFPANLIHDGSDEVLALFPQSNGAAAPVKRGQDGKSNGIYSDFAQKGDDGASFYNDSGSAARFFYCAKPSKSERNIGCENLTFKSAGECTNRVEGSAGLNSPRAGAGRTSGSQNNHPTVKSISLMKYLCKLITPPNGIVLDPFCGSGSTGLAAYLEGFQCIMIDKEPHFCEIAEARMKGIIKENNKS